LERVHNSQLDTVSDLRDAIEGRQGSWQIRVVATGNINNAVDVLHPGRDARNTMGFENRAIDRDVRLVGEDG
jgi:hypothetical protein